MVATISRWARPWMPPRRAAIPRSGARRATAPQPPRAVEHYLVVATQQLVRSYIREVGRMALAVVDQFAKQDTDDEGRTDANDGHTEHFDRTAAEAAKVAKAQAAKAREVTSHMRAVTRRALRHGVPIYEARSKKAADRANAHTKKELARVGLKVPQKEPTELKWLIDGWRKDNVARIKGLADHQIKQIEQILAKGYNRKPESIVKDIKELILGISDRRAELIARDQVLTLNAQINRYRQTAAGVTSYIWTTQHDDRVRETHAALDGQEFTWDSGGDPDEGHPGMAVNCRCVAWPIPPPTPPDDGSGGEASDDN